MKELWQLFGVFARLGAVTFGGGYAMLPILQREIVEKRNWATEDEVMDYYAIGQCTPGIISVNVSTFIGFKLKGILGGIIATLGFIAPSIVIIAVIATFISAFADAMVVKHAFAGIRVCVCVLIFNAVIKLGKGAVKDIVTGIVCALVFLAATFTPVSPIILVVLAGAAGAVSKAIGRRFAKDKGGKNA
ncbi:MULTISPECIES: chromate transporter [unclassified Clostridium]|uniref:chromate transporter n=1 Tax=Clostridia TaxID=186801 RepID=UPI001106A97A|nr:MULTISPECIES: chromate transporter [unclassified Clostridium]